MLSDSNYYAQPMIVPEEILLEATQEVKQALPDEIFSDLEYFAPAPSPFEENYLVSNFAHIYNKKTKKLLTPSDQGIYLGVKLCCKQLPKPKNFRVHRLVALTFWGQIPKNIHVHHQNNPKDNNLWALELKPCEEHSKISEYKYWVSQNKVQNTDTVEWRRKFLGFTSARQICGETQNTIFQSPIAGKIKAKDFITFLKNNIVKEINGFSFAYLDNYLIAVKTKSLFPKQYRHQKENSHVQ